MALAEFIPVLVYLGTVGAVIGAMIVFAYLLSPRNPTPMKLDTFNCGQDPPQKSHSQFTFQYYPYLIMFLTFDVAGMFVMLWATTFRVLPQSATHVLLVMLLLLTIPMVLAYRAARRVSYWKQKIQQAN
ncbi:MAG: NADH-quinone oxidoreductase subunit A [Candidatus Ranarchaeia archaeon]|jgi:NADH-quinone oxidoreductase subunit A